MSTVVVPLFPAALCYSNKGYLVEVCSVVLSGGFIAFSSRSDSGMSRIGDNHAQDRKSKTVLSEDRRLMSHIYTSLY